MTILSKLIQFDTRPKRKPNKSIYLNKKEKLIKKKLAEEFYLSSFKGYKNWHFEYNNDSNGNMVEYDNVNKLIKDLCAGKIPTDESYYVTAELSFSGECCIMTYVNLQNLIKEGSE